jgi:hypothetical protein
MASRCADGPATLTTASNLIAFDQRLSDARPPHESVLPSSGSVVDGYPPSCA